MQSYSLPSDSYIDLTLGPSGSSYVAPANGWVTITVNGSGFVGVIQDKISFYHPAGSNTNDWYSAILPVRKGQFKIEYSSITVWNFKFIYAVGSAPQS